MSEYVDTRRVRLACRVPVLVVAGGPDSFLPQDRMAEMAALLPAGELTTVPVGHVVHPNAPAAFADAVETFLGAP